MNVHININTKEVVKHVNRLEKLHRSGLPSAIRGTLNRVAFDVKRNTMPQQADKQFEKRNPNFFKANSSVDRAVGFDVKSMASTVGFISSNLKYNNQAVRELEQQEYGGDINKRTFVPMDQSRTGASHSKAVRANFRLRKIFGKIVDSKNSQGVSRRQKFIKAATHAGPGGFVIGNLGHRTLYRIVGIKRVGGRTIITKIPLYSVRAGRSVGIKATGFMRIASVKSAGKMNEFFIEEAERQIRRLTK